MKKWQKIVIIVLLVLVIITASLKIFRRQVMSIMLNDKELATYDCYIKTKRVAKYAGNKFYKVDIIYYNWNDLLRIDIISKSKDFTESFGDYDINGSKKIDYFKVETKLDIESNKATGLYSQNIPKDDVYKSSDYYNFSQKSLIDNQKIGVNYHLYDPNTNQYIVDISENIDNFDAVSELDGVNTVSGYKVLLFYIFS